ncbi:MAG: phosphoenolpyruvate carboxylase [Lysobacterales bacterium]|jgi:phosphoenolpyruvate carboxylase
MKELRDIEFPDKDLPLRNDVSLLGALLGESLVEQHGEAFLQQVETVRRAAILRREGDHASAERLERTLATLGLESVRCITKAFSSYLRLVNVAEKTHRIRRRREYQKTGTASQRGGLDQVIAALAEAGVEAGSVRGALNGMRIQPVFTAHPTEATRRSFLEKEYSILHRLVERLNPDLTPQEERQALDRIRDAINSAWQTSTVPSVKPTVGDELDNVMFYLTSILYRVVPPFYAALEQAFHAGYGEEPPLAGCARLLRFGSWVGGDMDGNPNVGADTILATLATQRRAVIRCYRRELERLARYLSQTRGQAEFSPAVLRRLADYKARLPATADAIPARHREMPYRCLLRLILARLEATQTDSAHAYRDADAFAADIEVIADSLDQNKGRHAGLFGVRRLQQRITCFGFHLATLDTRQDALVHREVIGELLERRDWAESSPGQRERALTKWLDRDPPGSAPGMYREGEASEQARSSVAVFAAIAEARKRYGEDATGPFIISMTKGPDDVLSVLLLARIGGLAGEHGVPLDVAPLLETVDDLEAGPDIFAELLQNNVYRRHLESRGNRQIVMIGYSDSNKDSGIAAARWSLYEAQAELVECGHRHGVHVEFFHGRGGTVSRGGGNMVKGVEGAPAGSLQGRLRVTEQGEAINQKYGMRPLALRNLELMTGAVLRHGLVDTGQYPDKASRAVMADMASWARQIYQQMVYETPEFIPFYRSATPIDVIERLRIGSRPASRRSGEGIENLRAIPWVFAWAQMRVGFPGVYGVGGALAQAIEKYGIERLRAMQSGWSFFQGLISDVEMVLAKSDLEIGRRYAALAPASSTGVFERITEEFDQARRYILEIKQASELLAGQRALQRNIRLRNPYVDPMHILQIELLRRWRAGGREDESMLNTLRATVNGIALAIQNTG